MPAEAPIEPLPPAPEAPLMHPDQAYGDRPSRRHAVHLGMWLFLGSETLLFAGLFALYATYRMVYTAEFHEAAAHNDALVGTINTAVLLVSSFFVAWAVHAMRAGRRRVAQWSLILVIALGLTFLALKTVEYAAHLAEGIAPGAHYTSDALPSQGSQVFFTLYYMMTGLHALHVIGGLGLMLWLVVAIRRGRVNPDEDTPLELGGLYWHLIDIIWIFLWPILYLLV